MRSVCSHRRPSGGESISLCLLRRLTSEAGPARDGGAMPGASRSRWQRWFVSCRIRRGARWAWRAASSAELREGISAPLSARLARAWARAAHRDRPRDEERLVIEWPPGAQESAHYWLSTLPKNTFWSKMLNTLRSRWRVKRDYEKLKQALGLGHYGGRNWRGFHYHARSCIAAYGFLTLEQRSSRKKTPLDSKRLL